MGLVFILLFLEGIVANFISSIGNFSSNQNEILMIILILINVIFMIFVLGKESKGCKEIFLILLVSLFIRMIFLLVDMYLKKYFLLPNSGADTEAFNANALNILQHNFKGHAFVDDPYSYLVAVIYSIFLKQRIVAQYINLVFSMWTILIILKIFDRFNINKKLKIIMIALIAFMPNYALMSVVLLRESIPVFFLGASVLYFIKWWQENKIHYFIVALILSLIPAIFHSGMIGNAEAYIIIYILCGNKKRDFKIDIKSIVTIIFFIFILTLFNNFIQNTFMNKFGEVNGISDILTKTNNAEGGGSAYIIGGEVNNFFDLIKYTPIRVFYFIASPLPWDWRGLSDIIAFVFNALFYILAYIYAFKALLKNKKGKNIIKVFLLIVIAGAIIFAWGTSNAGTALRHRDKFIVNYIVMFALSLNYLYCNKKHTREA